MAKIEVEKANHNGSFIIALLGLLPVIYDQSRPAKFTTSSNGTVDGDLPWSLKIDYRYIRDNGKFLSRFGVRDGSVLSGLEKELKNLEITIAASEVAPPEELWENVGKTDFEKPIRAVSKGAREIRFFLPGTSATLAQYGILRIVKGRVLISGNPDYASVYLPLSNPLPGNPTQFYVGMVVDGDNQVAEFNEANNANQGAWRDRNGDLVTIVDPNLRYQNNASRWNSQL